VKPATVIAWHRKGFRLFWTWNVRRGQSGRPGVPLEVPRKPPSQIWRALLENHVQSLVSVDFFTVPTLRFQVLYVFLVLIGATSSISK